MSSLYDKKNINSLIGNKEYLRFFEPNLVRTRQIYKGPRDSEKVNLEIGQILYDIFSINERIEEIKLAQETVMEAFENGVDTTQEPSVYPEGFVPGESFFYFKDFSRYPDYNAVISYNYIVYSLEELQAKIASFIEFIKDFMSGVYTDG